MRTQVGDLFLVPITTERVSVGHVAWRRLPGRKSDVLLVVYEGIYPREPIPDLDAAIDRPIALQLRSFDVLITTGRWPLVGRRPVPSDRIRMPDYKVMTEPPDTYAVTDFTGRILRRAGGGDIDALAFASSRGPIALERAAQALAGLGSLDDYRALLPPTRGTPIGQISAEPPRSLWRRLFK